jgi:plastocyanin
MVRCRTFVACVTILAAVAGCQNSSYSTRPDSTASLRLEPSSREIVVGETVTFVARTSDTYGRDARVRWTATSGQLSQEQDGRVARVRFNDAGTYTVSASLMIDNQPVQSDMVEIRVKPIR